MNKLATPSIPYARPSNYILEGSCSATLMFGDEWLLQDSVYNCDALPTCDMTCGGPNKPKLSMQAESCSCMIQWGLHSMWLRAVLAASIYIIVNFTRTKLVKGISKIFWRVSDNPRLLVPPHPPPSLTPPNQSPPPPPQSLHSGLFTFKSSCTADGTVILPHDVASTPGVDLESNFGLSNALLVSRLQRAVKKIRIKGLLMATAAIGVNVAWAWALMTFTSWKFSYAGI